MLKVLPIELPRWRLAVAIITLKIVPEVPWPSMSLNLWPDCRHGAAEGCRREVFSWHFPDMTRRMDDVR